MPAQHDLNIYTGDTYKLVYTLFERIPDPAHAGEWIKGDPLKLTGATAEAEIRLTFLAAPEVVEPYITEFSVVNTPLTDDGRIELELSSAQTKLFRNIKKAVWDMQVTRPDGSVTTYVYGSVVSRNDVTEGAVV